MRGTLLIVTALLLAGGAKSADPSPAKPKAEKPKKVCHEETDIGSSISHRVCYTPEEEKQVSQDAQQQMDQYRTGLRPSGPK